MPFFFCRCLPVVVDGGAGLDRIFLCHGVSLLWPGLHHGGVIANVLNHRIDMHAQIGWGVALIGIAGIALCLAVSSDQLSILSLLLPLMVCTMGTTIIRPAATTYALGLHPERAGAAASAHNTMLFAFGGAASMLLASVEEMLPMSLALSFVVSCLSGWLLLAYVSGLVSQAQVDK